MSDNNDNVKSKNKGIQLIKYIAFAMLVTAMMNLFSTVNLKLNDIELGLLGVGRTITHYCSDCMDAIDNR